MKMMHETLLIFLVGFALEAVAAPPTPKAAPPKPPPQNSPSASAVTGKKSFHWFAPSPSENQSKIERVGKMSSRPWTKIVGWHPGASQFPTAENHESQLILVSLKF
jgi:hypothetical protein